MILDDIDRQILAALQDDGRLSNAELARRIGLSPTPCLRRTRRLEQRGVIQGYRAVVSPQHTGRGFRALIAVRLARHNRQDVQQFETRLRQLPHLDAAFHVTGNYDYLLLVSVADLAGYEYLHAHHLTDLPAIAQINTYIIMNELDPASEHQPR